MRYVLATLVLIGISAGGTASAQQLMRSGPALEGTLRMSLGDAVAMGLENNLEVEIARHGPLIAEEDLTIAWGAFDPLFSGEAGYFNTDQPNSSLLAGVARSEQELVDGVAGISALIPMLGATVGVDYVAQRLDFNVFHGIALNLSKIPHLLLSKTNIALFLFG